MHVNATQNRSWCLFWSAAVAASAIFHSCSTTKKQLHSLCTQLLRELFLKPCRQETPWFWSVYSPRKESVEEHATLLLISKECKELMWRYLQLPQRICCQFPFPYRFAEGKHLRRWSPRANWAPCAFCTRQMSPGVPTSKLEHGMAEYPLIHMETAAFWLISGLN